MGSKILANNLTSNTNTTFEASGANGASKLEGLEVILQILPDEAYDGTVTMHWSPDGVTYAAFGTDVGTSANSNLSAISYDFSSASGGPRLHRFVCPRFIRMVTASRTAGGVSALLLEA